MMKRPEGWIWFYISNVSTQQIERLTYVIDCLLVKVVSRDRLPNYLLKDLLPQLLSGNVLRMLGRHDNSVNTLGDNSTVVVLVLNGDLGLGVGPKPWERTVTASSRHNSVQFVGENDSQGEELRSLVGGISKHDTLVTGAKLLECLVEVKSLGNVLGLLLNGYQDVTGLVVETLVGIVISDFLDGATDNLLVVKLGAGGDFAKDHDHASLGGSLTTDLGEGILS